jgi:V8-like Glu-specific endopeptidase
MKNHRAEVAHSLERLESPFVENELLVRETGDEWKARASTLAAESPFLRTFESVVAEAAPGEASSGFELETAAGLRDKLTHLSLFPHWVKKDGKDVEVTRSVMDPGIYDGPVKYKIALDLQKCLNAVMDTDKFRHIRATLVDLTKDVTKPEFAGFHHKQPVFAASVPKMAAMLAVFQMRHDLRVAQKDKPAKTLAELYSRMRDDWAATVHDPGGAATKFSGGISLRGKLVLVGGWPVALVDSKGQVLPRSPRLEKMFADVPAGNPVGIDFSSTGEDKAKLRELIKAFRPDVPATWKDLDSLGFLERLRITMGGMVQASNYTTSTIVADVGFPYIASTLLQTGLFDLDRNGGLWLGVDYWGTSWRAAPGGGAIQNATAGSAAALMTLLVQRRFADALSSSEMRTLIQKTPLTATHPQLVSWFEAGLEDLPGRGNIKTALSKLGVLTGIDDCAYFEREVDDGKGRKLLLRYVAVALRARVKEELKALILELDKCILANNKLTPADGGHREEHEADLPYALSEAPSAGPFALEEEDIGPESESGPEPITEEEAGIIGGRDDRVPVRDSLAIPFRWICRIWAQKRIKTPGHEEKRGLAPAGTGLLISPRHVLTAAHVLRGVEEKGSVVEEQEAFHVEVAPAANGGKTPFGRIEATSWELAPKWNPAAHSSQHDYAVITLKEAVGDKTLEAWKGQSLCFWGSPTCGADTSVDALPSALAKKLIGTRVLTAGFPRVKKGEMWCAFGKFSAGAATDAHLIKQGIVEDWSKKAGVFFVTADATEGQSGSPVWVVDGRKRYLIGILVSVGEKDYNTALNLREEVVRQILSWTGQTSAGETEVPFEQPEWLQEESAGAVTEPTTQPEIDESEVWDEAQEGRFDTETEYETGEHSETLEVEDLWDEEHRDSRDDEESVVIQYDAPDTTTQVVAVGERVTIDLAKTSFAAKLDKVKWTIPGRVVRRYDGTVNDSKLFELTDSDLEQPKISFFWVDPGDGRNVYATVKTKSGAVEVFLAPFDVKGPKLDRFTAKTGITQIEKRAGLTGMRFGRILPRGKEGIRWEWQVTMPATHAGFVKDVQTVLNDRWKIQRLRPGGTATRKLVWKHPKKTDPNVQLDGHDGTEAVYTGGIHGVKIDAGKSSIDIKTSDSPHTSIERLDKTVSVNDQFTYYIMFKPATAKAEDAIWVPVAKAKWFWKATAKDRVLRAEKMKPDFQMATTDFPIYESNAAENEWQEVSP